VPIFCESVLNASTETIAPTLPIAAEIPCAKAQKRVGSTSPGYVALRRGRTEQEVGLDVGYRR
jgi:hypothetical protein